MDIYTLTITLDPLATDERLQLVNIIQTLRGVKCVETHLQYGTREPGKQTEVSDIWDTLNGMIQSDKNVPPFNKAKIALGRPVSFEAGILTVAHPEADWAQARYARTMSNWIVALKPGARVVFQAEAAQ